VYVPEQFEESSIEVMHELIRRRPLATLVTIGPAGVEANHIPLTLIDQAGAFGSLRGHVARSNPLWQNHPQDTEILAIFHGPESYITPSWYASKAEDGKVVPTWNFVSVHARGRLRVVNDAKWLRSQLEILTAHNEKPFAHQWAVSDAPHDFTEKLIESIIGIEIVITELKGKWKVSQNRPLRDRVSVIEGLHLHGQDEMADLVRSSGGDPE
jgi:transcriptional regulator